MKIYFDEYWYPIYTSKIKTGKLWCEKFAYIESPPKIQKVTKRSKKWRNGAKSNETETKSDETETKSDETEQKVAKRTLLYGNINKKKWNGTKSSETDID